MERVFNKSLKIIIAIMLLITVLSITSSSYAKINIKVTKVTLKPTSVTRNIGETIQLTPTVKPSFATNKKIKWSSNNTKVATVDSNGLVTTKAVGKATITAQSESNSKKSATCVVTVEKKTEVTGIGITATASVYEGKTVQLSANVTPSTAKDKRITWSSENKSIATVDSNGLVKGIKPGTAKIRATSVANSSKSVTCTVTVKKVTKATKIKLNTNEVRVEKGKTYKLSATITPSNTTFKEITWSSSNTAVATVDSSGKVTAKGTGTAIITALKDGVKDTCTVVVPRKFYEVAADCHRVVSNRGFTYGGQSFTFKDKTPANTRSLKIDCSGYVSWVLYEYAKDIGNNGLKSKFAKSMNTSGFATALTDTTYFKKIGKMSDHMNDLQRGDILLHPGDHIEIFGYKDGSKIYSYNCGGPDSVSAQTTYQSAINIRGGDPASNYTVYRLKV